MHPLTPQFRLLAALTLLLSPLACPAANRPTFASSDRVVTIEQRQIRDKDETVTVWAVLPARIVSYRREATGAEKLINIAILPEADAENIRQLVAQISPESRGKIWLPRGTQDGVGIRISFTGDGTLRDDRIEYVNHWRKEFEALFNAISDKMAPADRITYRQRVSSTPPREGDLQSVSIKEYYNSSQPPAPAGRP